MSASLATIARITVCCQTAPLQKEQTWMVFMSQSATASQFRPSKTTPKVAKRPALAGK